MKLRIRANSLRLRLNQKEVKALASGRVLKEKIDFPGSSSLSYVLKSHGSGEPQVFFTDGSIQVTAPITPLLHWAEGEEIGLYYSLATGVAPLQVAIEKDLECIDGPEEEKDPFAFPRELSEKVC